MNRVMIVGQPGSGKSTLARQLGQATGLPVYHMDQIHWTPGWVERPKDEKVKLALEIEGRDRWVFEGGLSATYAHRASRADTLVVMEFPVWLRLWRVLKRILRWHGRIRPDLPDGCPGQFDPPFFLYIWRTRISGKRRIHEAMAALRPDQQLVHIRTLRQARAFLAPI